MCSTRSEMAKQVIFWCAVFMVLVVSAVLLGEMWYAPQAKQTSAHPVPANSLTASAQEESAASKRSRSQQAPIAKAAEPSRRSNR